MAYRLAQQNGDAVRVPQLIFTKLPQLEDDWLRVALYVVATGQTDEAAIARALHLAGPEKAREALVYWKGVGLLETADAPAAPAADISAAPVRTRLTAPEIARAAEADPNVSQLVQECQRLWGGVIPQGDANILASLYLADGLPIDLILLGVAHFTALGKRSARYIERALLGWQAEGIDTAEAAERHLALLAQREKNEAAVAGVFGLENAKFTKLEKNMIAAWFEEYGYGREMIAEALAEAAAGLGRALEEGSAAMDGDVINCILRAWYTKGHRTVRDVMAESAGTMRNFQPASPAPKPVLGRGLRRVPKFKKNGGAGHDE